MQKILLFIFDGMPDRQIKKLKNKTPLQFAKKPNFNYFAKRGTNGTMDTIELGIRPGSDTSHLAILGYNPYEVYTGRGPFESAGAGLEVKQGDIAFRGNFATVDENFKILDRRAGRIKSGTEQLAKKLNGMEIDGVKILFKETVEHRAVLILRGKKLSPNISDTDPHESGECVLNSSPNIVKEEKSNKEEYENAKFTSEVLNKFTKESYKILNSHKINIEREKQKLPKANIVLVRGGGIAPKLQSIEKKYGLKSCCIAGVSLVKGVCRIAGMNILNVKGATGTANTDINAKCNAGINALEKYDFVLVNIKACDLFGHDNLPMEKVKIIEKIDKALEIVKKEIGNNLLILTSDHSTPCEVKEHSADFVPIIIFNSGRIDKVKEYDEISCSEGAIGRIRGINLMNIVMDLTNRAEKFGA